jgi:aspartate/methionine/tyrosine aminotransferase
MHPLACELNTSLSGTVVDAFLSAQGRRLYFPRGIVAQAQEAGEKQPRYNATAGLARTQREPFMLPALKTLLPVLSPAQAVDYAPTGGDPRLRRSWRRLQVEKNPGLASLTCSLPLVTAGVTHALTLAADLFIEAGDTVLLPEPAWDNYELVLAEKRGAAVSRFPFFDRHSRFNVDAIDRRLEKIPAGGKAALMLNFPHNPTGYALSPEEAAAVTDVLLRHARRGVRLLVVVDDAYFGLFFRDGLEKQSLFTRLAGLHENLLAVKLDGTTKEDLVWGFRIGFLTLGARGLAETHYRALENKLLAAVRTSVSSASRPAQSLLLMLWESEPYKSEKEAAFAILKKRYQTVSDIVSHAPSPHLSPLPFNSGYFLTFRTRGVDAFRVRKYLLHEKNVGVIALGPDLLRVSYAGVDEEDLPDLFRLIYEAAEALSPTKTTEGTEEENNGSTKDS